MIGENITKEECQLLVEDLCSRLPYGVMVAPADMHFYAEELSIISLEGRGVTQTKEGTPTYIINTMPYLRPMDSMTAEEREEYENTLHKWDSYTGTCGAEPTYKTFAFLNRKMFDYRGLIELGIALNVYEYKHIYEWLGDYEVPNEDEDYNDDDED